MRKLTTLLLLMAYASMYAIDTYYVRPTGDVTSWSTQATADPAQVLTITEISELRPYTPTGDGTTTGTGTTFYLAKGTYLATSTTITYQLDLHNGEKIYGGLVGNESTIVLVNRELFDRDENGIIEPWEFKNEAIITGNFVSTRNSKRFLSLRANAEADGITLKDFGYTYTLNNGIEFGSPILIGSYAVPGVSTSTTAGFLTNCSLVNISSQGRGGALIITNPSSIVNNCLIEQCLSNRTTSVDCYGGAVYIHYNGGKIKNSVFRNNKVAGRNGNGGAVFAETPPASTNANVTIENCLFYNNMSWGNNAGYGGAIRTQGVVGYLGAQIINCTFANNSNRSGGGCVELSNTGTLVNCINYGGSNGFRALGTNANYYLEKCITTVANLEMAANATSYPTSTLNASADFGFERPTTFNGAIFPGETDYATKIDAIRKANYSITKATTILPANIGLQTIPASYTAASPANTITLGTSIPTNDLAGVERKSGAILMGAYNYTPAITGATNISAIGTINDKTKITVNAGAELTVDATTPVGSITVAPGAKLTLSSGTLTTTNGITLQSDATGTATIKGSGTYTGTINAQQYLGSARNWYVSSPVQVTNSPTNNISRYYEYVEPGNNNYPKDGSNNAVNIGETSYWKYWTSGNSMTKGKGYIAQASTGTTIQFSGTPNNGDIETEFNLTRNDDKGRGFNLVGNPYPSYLDWSMVAAANTYLMSTAWFKTKKTDIEGAGYTFASINVEDPENIEIVDNNANTTVSKYIPPMQAFWVRVKSGTSSTTMSFTNAMREHRLNNGDILKARKANVRTRLRLQLANGFTTDETLIYFDQKASNDYNEYDSPKMMNNSSIIPDLYTKCGTERLVINGLNEVSDNMELALGFSLNAAATLKLKATELSNFPEGIRVYLLDKANGIQSELNSDTEYTFSTNTSTVNNENRFSLFFRAPGVTTGVNTTEKLNAQVFVNAANQITIIASEKSNYAIYNALGQLSAEGTINHSPFTINHSKGVYVVKVNNQSTRVIIK